jgi:hypothetical protein
MFIYLVDTFQEYLVNKCSVNSCALSITQRTSNRHKMGHKHPHWKFSRLARAPRKMGGGGEGGMTTLFLGGGFGNYNTKQH